MTSTQRKDQPGTHSEGPVSEGNTSAAMEILNSIGEALYEWSIGSDTIRWGRNAATVLGVSGFDIISTGTAYAGLLDPCSNATPHDIVLNSEARDMGSGVPYQIEYALAPRGHEDGTRVWVEDTGRWFAGQDGRPERAHGVVRVIGGRHEVDQRHNRVSHTDELTGQMNRSGLVAVLADAIDNAKRQRSSCAFLVISLDNLSVINDAYGFDIADQIIAKVGGHIKSRLRGADALGRFSGNKFGVVLANCDRSEIEIAASRFLSAVTEEVISTDRGTVAATVTIGGVCVPANGRTAHEAMTFAQEALDNAKVQGRGSFVCYEPSRERMAMRQNNMDAASEILKGLNENRLRLAYQPVVASHDSNVAFHECLMRLEQSDGTIVPAGRLMPVAEKLGLVRLVDQRILQMVLEELANCREARLSVNVSPQSAVRSDWLDTLSAALARLPNDVAPRLIVEITETAAIESLEETTRFVTRVRELGAKIAIDDFGAGYTSFRNLKNLCFDIVKIDGSFVQNLATEADDRIFVRTLVDLAKSFSIETVAEWVSDTESVSLLNDMGVSYLQGNYVAAADITRPWQNDRQLEDDIAPDKVA